MHIKLWELLRDALEGTPPKAAPASESRPRARIVLEPPADVAVAVADEAEPEPAPAQHEEGGEVFVSVPPPEE